jgi:hypothetical protein
VQVWWAIPDSFADPALTAHERVLPDAERASVSRFVFERDRKQAR